MKYELSHIEWLERMIGEMKIEREKEKILYGETLYLDGFIQAMMVTRSRMLAEEGIPDLELLRYQRGETDDWG